MPNKRVFSSLVLAGFLSVSTTNAQSIRCYTLASLKGSWGLVTTYGANVATAFGSRDIDGSGNMTGVFTLNAPKIGSTTGERTIPTGTQAGTVAVNCDGSGTITRLTTSTLGVVATAVDDFVITGAILSNGQLIATAMTDAQRIPSFLIPGGIYLTRVHTRLPDRSAEFVPDNASSRAVRPSEPLIAKP